MKSTQKSFATRASVIAVRGTLLAMAIAPAAYAADASEQVRDLTQPTSKVEVGVGNVSKDSAKFGEYNGMNEKGSYFIGNFDVRGGTGDDSAFRWRANGSNLGLDTRNLGAEVGVQGQYRVTFGYDQLKRDYTDSFQTIYDGVGGRNLTLPASYPAAATRLSNTANQAGALSNWANLQSPYATAACATAANSAGACAGPGVLIPALMRNPGDISTKRTRGDLGFSYRFDREWSFKASVRREEKEGVKLTGFGVNGPGRGFMLPEPIDSTTDIYEAGVSYVGKSGYMNFGYAGSIYKNSVDLWTAQNPFQNLSMLNNIAQLSGAPDNQMHQFNLSGGFNFTPKTKLVLSGSYARMTQNEGFSASYPASFLIPVTSANAKVINTSFLARLTTRPISDLTLNAAYKYDDRDNQTPANLFSVAGADNGTSATTNRTFYNEPFSRRQQKFNLDADYSLGRGRVLAAGYEWHEITYRAHGEVEIPSEGNKEDTWRLEYRDSLADRLTGKVSYAHSQRRMEGEYRDGNPYPVSPVVPDELPASLFSSGRLTATGGVLTQVAPFSFSAADPLLPGFRQFFVADRNRDKMRFVTNYQASDALALDANLDYNRDKYNNSQYGLKESRSWVLSLDGSYLASENLSFNANYTYEDMKSRMDSLSILRVVAPNTAVAGTTTPALLSANNAAVCVGSTITNTAASSSPANHWLDPCRMWGMEQVDKIDTIGLGVKSNGLMAGKLELTGDVLYSRSRTPIAMSGGTYTSNGTSGAGSKQVYYSAQSLPEITSKTTELRVSAKYGIDKVSAVRVNYLYSHLSSADFQYDAFAGNPVAMQTYLGVGMTSPNYTVNALGVTYIYTFR